MRVDVAFVPGLAHGIADSVCVVLDILRASSSIVTMFARGIAEVTLADEAEEARRLVAADSELLLCGEEGGLPPLGFHYGNSPRQFAAADLAGRSAVLVTSNGTRALLSVADAGASVALVGSLLNLQAAASAALDAAIAGGYDILLICAGEAGGSAFALEDAYGAGAMVERLVRRQRQAVGAPPLVLSDTAEAAWRLGRSFHGRAKAALRLAEHGEYLRRLGLGHDVAFCARLDYYDVVPRLSKAEDGRLVLRAE